MADPLSIASGVITLLSSAYHICAVTLQSVDAIRSAPLHISRIVADLRAFCYVLTTLKALLDDHETARGVLHPASSSATDIELVVRNCHSVLEEIARALRPFGRLKPRETGGSASRDDREKGKMLVEWRMKGWQGLRWGLCGEKEMERLRTHLAAHKMTLSLTIAAANLINTTSANCSTHRLEAEIRSLKTNLTKLLERVDSAPTSSSSACRELEISSTLPRHTQSNDAPSAGLLDIKAHDLSQACLESHEPPGSGSQRSSSSYATARSSLLEEQLNETPDDTLCEPSSPAPRLYGNGEGNTSQTTLIGSVFTTESMPISTFSVDTGITLVEEDQEARSSEQEKEVEVWGEMPAELVEARDFAEKVPASKFAARLSLRGKAPSKLRSSWNWRLRGHSGSAAVA